MPVSPLTDAQRRSLSFLRWMIAACIALPLGLFAAEGYISYGSVVANADLEIARTRDIAREHAAKVLETIERSLAEAAEMVRGRSDNELRAREEALHERLDAISHALPQLKSLWVLDAQGRAIVTSAAYPAPQISFADREYFVAHRDRDIGRFLGGVLTPRPPLGGPTFFSMSQRRPTVDGSFAGVIQASIYPEYFEQFYRQIGFEPGALVMLALADGLVLASNPRFPESARITADGEIGRQLVSSPDAGLFTAQFPLDGVERRLAYEKLAAFPVYVIASLPTEAIVARWLRDFLALLAIAVPGTILLFALLWLYFRGTKRLFEESAIRERAETALRQNQRLEALGQLTGGVAHDFNNLLTVIGSSADLLRRPTVTEERRIRYIDAITQTVGRATKLTSQLLAFARRQPLTMDVFDAGERATSMAGMLTTLLGSVIDLRIRPAPHACLVETDGSQFETAIINLAANARDAMTNGGVLTIAIDRAEALPDHLAGAAATSYVRITVADTGRGIPADTIDRIFEPFFTTKDVGRGTGLGLSQVFGFVRQSHGDVSVKSVAGQGTTFTMFLPRALAPAAPAPETPGRPPSPARTIRVLLVDDNADVLSATGSALRERGFIVVTAKSADDALYRLPRLGALDVVLTDVVMPGTGGLDLARELRRLRPALPVILATGYSDAIEHDEVDGFAVIRKPYPLDVLAARLSDAAAGDRETA